MEKGGRQTADLLAKVVGNLKRIGFEVDGVASSTVFSDLKEKMERYSQKFESLQSTAVLVVPACCSAAIAIAVASCSVPPTTVNVITFVYTANPRSQRGRLSSCVG